MSTSQNTELLERANELLNEWSGTLWEKELDRVIKSGDLEQLYYTVRQAELALEETE